MKNATLDMVNSKILESLDNNIVPWKMPYESYLKRARSFITKKEYSLVNTFLIWICTGFPSGEFMTFKQIQSKKFHLKKGSHGSPIIYYEFIQSKKKDEDKINNNQDDSEIEENEQNKKSGYSILKHYTVFNTVDVEGISEENQLKSENNDQKRINDIINNYIKRENIVIKHAPCIPHYNTKDDYISVPDKKYFNNNDINYYKTLLHELVHSTLKNTRCNRHYQEQDSLEFETHSLEELIAEIGSCYLAALCGLPNDDETIENSVNYCKNWSTVLKSNPRWFIKATTEAEKAVNYILSANN